MSYISEILADSPAIWLRFQETTGTTAADSSGNSRNATLAGSPTLGLTGPVASAIGMDGVDDAASSPDGAWLPHSGAEAFTVEFWYKGTSTAFGTVAAKDGWDGGWRVAISNTVGILLDHKQDAQGQATTTNVAATNAITQDGQWHHYVAAWTFSEKWKLYIDGDGQALTTASSGATFNSTDGLTIGRRATAGGASRLIGSVAEFAFYYGVGLSAARAVAHYSAATATPPSAPTDLTATAASTSTIDLAWTDTSADETGFTVQRCTGPGCSDFTTIASPAMDAESYTDSGLAPDTSYSYRIRAEGAGGSSAWSATATATTEPTPDPGGSIDPSIPDERPNTGPFKPEVAEVIAGGVVEITGRLRFPGTGTTPVELAIIDGRLSWSERRSPRFTATLDCAIPDEEILDLIDPRALVRVDVQIGYRLPDGSLDEHVIASPHLRDRRILRPGEVLRLELAGDEALVIDASTAIGDTDSGVWTVPNTDVPRAVAQLITGLLSTGPAAQPPIVYAIDKIGTGEDVPWPPSDYWDAIEDLLEQVDAEVAADDGRTFRIQGRRNRVEATTSFVFRTGVGGVLLDSESSASRDDWANQVVLRHQWTDAAGDTHTVQGVATVTGGPFAPAVAGLRMYVERRTTPVTDAGATKAAQTLLRRMLSRSRGYVLSAPSAYWLRPGHTVTVDLDASDTTRHLVAHVDHTLADGRMRVVTRLPDTASTIGE